MSDPTASRTGYRLDRKKVYILPTRHGTSFACALTVMLIGSINYDNSLGYLLTFLLGSVALVSVLHTYRNLAGLIIRAGIPEPVFMGDCAELPVTIDNRTGPQRHALMLIHPAVAPPASGAPSRWRHWWRWRVPRRPPPELGMVVRSLPPRELTSISLPIRLGQRGHIEIHGLVIASRYPLGLFRAWSRIDLAPVALAYPQPRRDNLIRISVGCEDIQDIIADFRQALERA